MVTKPTDYDQIREGIYYKRGSHGFLFWWVNGHWIRHNGTPRKHQVMNHRGSKK